MRPALRLGKGTSPAAPSCRGTAPLASPSVCAAETHGPAIRSGGQSSGAGAPPAAPPARTAVSPWALARAQGSRRDRPPCASCPRGARGPAVLSGSPAPAARGAVHRKRRSTAETALSAARGAAQAPRRGPSDWGERPSQPSARQAAAQVRVRHAPRHSRPPLTRHDRRPAGPPTAEVTSAPRRPYGYTRSKPFSLHHFSGPS